MPAALQRHLTHLQRCLDFLVPGTNTRFLPCLADLFTGSLFKTSSEHFQCQYALLTLNRHNGTSTTQKNDVSTKKSALLPEAISISLMISQSSNDQA